MLAESRKRGVLSRLTGADVFADAAASTGETARTGWRATGRMVRAFTAPEPKWIFPEGADDPAVRYRLVAETFGIDDARRREIMDQSHSQFLFRVGFAIVLILWAFVFAPDLGLLAGGAWSGLVQAAMAAPAALLLLKAAHHSITNRHVHEGRLVSRDEWLRQPSRWWTRPAPALDAPSGGQGAPRRPAGRRDGVRVVSGNGRPDRTGRALRTLFWLTVAFQVVVPGAAYAVGWDFLNAPLQANDLSRKWTEILFPSLVGRPANMIGDMVLAFNSALMLVAVIVMSWQTIQGMVATAHEGKLLGQKWHSIYAPIRVTIGISTLAPIAGGFNLAQFFVLQVFIWGFGLANAVWNSTIDYITDPNRGYGVVATPSPVHNNELLRTIVETEVCAAVLRAIPTSGDTPFWDVTGWFRSKPNVVLPDPAGETRGLYKTWNYGTTCGGFSIKAKHIGTEPGADHLSTYHEATSRAVADLVAKVRAASVIQQYGQALQPGSGVAPPDPAAWKRAVDELLDYVSTGAFPQAVSDAAKTYAEAVDGEAREKFKEDAKAFGWASAGSFGMTISRMSALVADKSHLQLQSVRELRLDDLPEEWKTRGVQALEGFRRMWGDVVGDRSEIRVDATSAGVDPGEQSILSRAFAPISNAITKWSTDELKLSETAPMASMINLGHFILNLFMTAFVATMAFFMFARGTAESALKFAGGGAAGGALEFLSIFIITIVTGLLAAGVVHAYILPLVQYSMWTFAMIGIIVFMAEAVIAASIWAFMHVRMDGQELIDNPQRAGYTILFNAFFRPVLTLFGLIIGMLTLAAAAALLNATFAVAASGQQAGNFVFIVGFMVQLGFITYMHYQITIRSFSLIHMMPDRVARWMGAQAEGLGEENENRDTNLFIGGQVKNITGTGVNAVVHRRKAGGGQLPGTPPEGDTTKGGGSGGGAGSKDKDSKESPSGMTNKAEMGELKDPRPTPPPGEGGSG